MVRQIMSNNVDITVNKNEIVDIMGNNNDVINYGTINKLLGNNNDVINYNIVIKVLGTNNDVTNKFLQEDEYFGKPLNEKTFNNINQRYFCMDCNNWFDNSKRVGNPGGSSDVECPICVPWKFTIQENYKKSLYNERSNDKVIWDGSVPNKTDDENEEVIEQSDLKLEKLQNKVQNLLMFSKRIKNFTIFSICLSVLLTIINLFSTSIIFNMGIGFANFLILCRNIMWIGSLAGAIPLFLAIRVIRVPMVKQKIKHYVVEKEIKEMKEKRNIVAANALSDKSANLYIQLDEELKDINNKGICDLLNICKERLSSAEKRYIKIKKVLTKADQLDTLNRVLITMAQSLDDVYNATNKIINRAIIFEDDMSTGEQINHRKHIENILKNMVDVEQKMGELSNETLSYMEDKNADASTLAIEALIEALASLHTKILEN